MLFRNEGSVLCPKPAAQGAVLPLLWVAGMLQSMRAVPCRGSAGRSPGDARCLIAGRRGEARCSSGAGWLCGACGTLPAELGDASVHPLTAA